MVLSNRYQMVQSIAWDFPLNVDFNGTIKSSASSSHGNYILIQINVRNVDLDMGNSVDDRDICFAILCRQNEFIASIRIVNGLILVR